MKAAEAAKLAAACDTTAILADLYCYIKRVAELGNTSVTMPSDNPYVNFNSSVGEKILTALKVDGYEISKTRGIPMQVIIRWR